MQREFLKYPKEYLDQKQGLSKAYRLTPNFGHNHHICCISFTHDGKYFLTSSWDQTIKIWEFNTGKYVKTLEGLTGVKNGFVISSDDSLVAGYSGNYVRVWELATGKIIQTIYGGEEPSFTDIAISRDGKQIVVGSSSELDPKKNNAQIWNIKKNILVRTISDYNREVNHVAISPNDEYLVIGGGWRREVNIYNFENFSRETITMPHRGHLTNIHISPSSNMLICSSFDKTISIYNLRYKKIIGKIKEHPYEIGDIKASIDDTTLISSSAGYRNEENALNIWKIQTGELLSSINGKMEEGIRFSYFAISPDGKFVVSGCESDIIIWEISSGKMVKRIKGNQYRSINLLALSSEKGHLITSSTNNGIEIWNESSGKLKSLHELGEIRTILISPDRKYSIFSSSDRNLGIYSMERREILHNLKTKSKFWNPLSISPDSKYVVCHSDGLYIIEIKSGAIIKKIDIEGTYYSCAFTPDGKALLISWFDYNPPDGRDDEWDEEGIKRVSVIEIPSGNFIRELRSTGNNLRKVLHRIQISPDKKFIIGDIDQKDYNLYGSNIGIWDYKTGVLTKILNCNEGSITVLSFSSDGRLFASGSSDHIVRVWDLEKNYFYGPFSHDSAICNIEFIPDSSKIVVGDKNVNVFIWNFMETQKSKISINSENEARIRFGKFYWEGEQKDDEAHREEQYDHLKDHIKDIIFKGDMHEITELFRKEVFEQLNHLYINKLYSELSNSPEQINLFEVFFNVNLEIDSHLTIGNRWGENSTLFYIWLPTKLRLSTFIKEGIMKIIKRNKENEIELLIKLGYLSYLDKNHLKILLEDTNLIFSDMILRWGYMDSIITRNIKEFLDLNKSFVSDLIFSKWKNVLESNNFQKIFNLWDRVGIGQLSEEKFLLIFRDKSLNYLEKVLMSIHEIAYVKKDYRFNSEIMVIPPKFRDKFTEEIKDQIIGLVKNQNFDALYPLVADYFSNCINENDIKKLLEDEKIPFFKSVIKILGDHRDELTELNDDFYFEQLNFFKTVKSMDPELIKILVLSVMRENLVSNYYPMIEYGLLEKISFPELIKILSDLTYSRLIAFLTSLTSAVMIFRDFESYDIEKSKLYYKNLGSFLTFDLKNQIVMVFKDSKVIPFYYSGKFLRDEWDLPLAIKHLEWYQYFSLDQLRELSTIIEQKILDREFNNWDKKELKKIIRRIKRYIKKPFEDIEITSGQLKEFIRRLAGPEGCQHEGFRWRCGGKEFIYARKVLDLMNIPEVTQNKLLKKCKEFGGYCDCEILMNAAPMLLGEETPW